MILTRSDKKGINVNKLINERAEADKLDTLLLVVPTNRRAHQLKIDLLNGSASSAIHPMRICTITTLTFDILESMGDPAALVSEAVSVLFIKQCLNEITELRYFSRYKEHIPEGLLLILRQMFSDWKRQLLSPEDVRAQINLESNQHEQVKAGEIIDIYEMYCRKLSSTGRYEIGDAYQAILKDKSVYITNFRKIFPTVDTVIVTGYSELSAPEIDILDYCSAVPGCELFVEIDYNEYNLVLFGHLNECIAQFRKKDFSSFHETEAIEERGLISASKDNLFLYRPGQKRDNRFSNQITYFSADTLQEEIIHIAKSIRRLIKDEKVNPARICVAIHIVQNYSALIREILPQYNVPFDLTDRPFLRSSVFVNAVLNYLEMERSDYYYKNVFRAFSNSYIPMRFCTPSDIIETATEYRIIGGLRNWLTAAEREPYDEEDALPEAIIQKAQKCAVEIERAHNELNVFNNLLTPKKFYTEFEKVTLNLGVHHHLDEKSIFQQIEAVTAMKALLNAVKEICEVLAMENSPKKKYTLDFYLRQISAALANTRYSLPGKSHDTVLITTPEEIRGLSFDHLFIAGLYDGNFPSRYSPDVFAPETLSRTEKQYIADQQYLFFQTLTTGKRLHFSRPKSDGGRALNQSHFLTSFLRVFGVTEERPEMFESIIASKQNLYSEMILDDKGRLPAQFDSVEGLPDLDRFKESAAADKNRIDKHIAADIYNGILSSDMLDEEARQALKSYAEKEYSISQLESYAGCPFRYFLQRVMGITVPEQPEEEASRMEFGSLLHKILFEFMQRVKAAGLRIYRTSSENKALLKTLIFDIAEKLIAGTETGKALTDWDRELLTGINGNRDASILNRFIEYEWENNPYEPFLFETAFGMLSGQAMAGSGHAHSGSIEVSGVKLRGKIDRIDIDRTNKVFNVVDYKTGANKYRKADVERGLQLQLPVYLHVARQILAAHPEMLTDASPLYPFIFSLKYREGEFGLHTIVSKKKGFTDPENIPAAAEMTETLIQTALEAIANYVNDICQGRFNHTRLEKKSWIERYACRNCDYKDICRYQEFISEKAADQEDDPDPEE